MMLFELLLLIALLAIVLFALRAAPVAPPIEIYRPGQYRLMLTGKAEQMRDFAESLAQALAGIRSRGDIVPRYFEVRDGRHEVTCLLAITRRQGMFMLQLIGRHPLQSEPRTLLESIRASSAAVWAGYPPGQEVDPDGAGKMEVVLGEVAQRMEISVMQLDV